MDLIARVIIIPTGTIHIAMENKKSVSCTTSSLRSFLCDPITFCKSSYSLHPLSTQHVNSADKELRDITGFTLIEAYNSEDIVIRFPQILAILFGYFDIKMVKNLFITKYEDKEQIRTKKDAILNMVAKMYDVRKDETQLLFTDPSDESLDEMFREFRGFLWDNTFQRFRENNKPTLEERLSEYQNISEPVLTSLIDIDDKEFINDEPALEFDSQKITAREYGERNNMSYSSVTTACKNGDLKSAIKIKNKWYIDPSEKLSNVRRCALKRPKAPKTQEKDKNSYEWTQNLIKRNKILSPEVGKHIRSYDELKYYCTHKYKEVHWGNIRALILDVVPEYIIKDHPKYKGKTNKDLMLSGLAPLVPNDEENYYEIHHIGQKRDSPLAMIPSSDHKKLSNIFHVKSDADESLHDDMFQLIKRNLYETYVQKYEEADGFRNIESFGALIMKWSGVLK